MVWRDAFLVRDYGFYFFIVSDASTCRMMDLCLRVLMKSCIPPVKGNTRCKVDYFWMLYSQRGCPYEFQLFTFKDQLLLVWVNTFLVLDFSFHIFYSIRCFYLQGDGFACEGFDENLHSSCQGKYKM